MHWLQNRLISNTIQEGGGGGGECLVCKRICKLAAYSALIIITRQV